MRAARRRPRRVLLNPEEELRAHKEPLKRPLDPDIKTALSASGPVKRHEHFHVFAAHRAAVRASFERRKDPARTGFFIGRRRRPAYEDAAAGRAVPRFLRPIGTADRNLLYGQLRAGAPPSGPKNFFIPQF